MADTSAHNKEVEDFVAAKIFVKLVKEGQLQGVDNAAYGANALAGRLARSGLKTSTHVQPIPI